jgi:hypothetical protein
MELCSQMTDHLKTDPHLGPLVTADPITSTM